MSNSEYRRGAFAVLLGRLGETRRHIQAVGGPRQVGKTTLVRQVVAAARLPSHMVSADDPALRDPSWLAQQWEVGRIRAKENGRKGAVLVLDEIQKVTGWSETVKRLWDEDSAQRVPLRVILLGSAPLLMQRGLADSLAGRFELLRLGHWSYAEMRAAFGWDLDRFVYFGGYPGAAALVGDEARWRSYVLDSLVETTLSRDVLLLSRVDKPALLRQLFRLACEYSAQVVAYTKLVGQLQDAGNTVTLAHYLELLAGAGVATGLEKYSGSRIRQRGSSPKLLALNTGLVSAMLRVPFKEARRTPEVWGRLVETAVGSHLLGGSTSPQDVLYWRDRGREVDFVVRSGHSLAAIEVSSGRRKDGLPGVAAFRKEHPSARPLLVGCQGLPLEEFLAADPRGVITR